MIAPQLQLLKDSNEEVCFAFRYKAGLFYSVLGAVIIYFCSRADFLIVQLSFGLFGVFIAVIGILALFKRFQLTLNLSERTYRISKGMWPTIRVTQGSLDELNSVELATRTDERGSGAIKPVWTISVNIGKWNGPISIFESYNELVAQDKLHYWAKKFGAKPVDLTNIESERNTSDNPESLIQRVRPTATATAATPPGIEENYSGGITTIILPRRKAAFGPVLEFIFMVIFCSGFAFLSLLIIFSDSSHRAKTTPGWMFDSIGIIFLAVAGYVFFAIMKKTWSREVITLDSAGLVRGTKVFGRVWDEVRLHRQEIREISIKKYSGATRDIETVTITGEHVLIRTGQTLREGQLEWLCERLRDKFGFEQGH